MEMVTSERRMVRLTAINADVREVAHALSRLCRFTGHTEVTYSVAQHSLLVASLVAQTDPDLAIVGLLHDAHEAYLGDISRPVKELYRETFGTGFDAIESRIQHQTLCSLLGCDVPIELPPVVKEADNILLAHELWRFFGIESSTELRALKAPINPWSLAWSKSVFLKNFEIWRERSWLNAWKKALA